MNRKVLSAIALTLALLAALTMFLDGITLTGGYLKPFQDQLDQYLGLAAYGSDIMSSMAGLSGAQAGMVRQELRLSRLLISAFRSGGLSVWEAFRALSALTVLYFRYGSVESGGSMFDMDDFRDQAGLMVALTVLLLLLLLGAAAALALSVRNMLRGRRNGSVLMAVVMLLTLAFWFTTVQIAMGPGRGVVPLSMTLWPVVGLALAIAGAVVGRRSPVGAAKPVRAPGRRPTAPKTAASSGQRRCPGCGKVYGPKTAFCGVCGIRLDTVVPPPKAAHCPHCGVPVKTGQRFCGKCGGAL